MTPTTDFRLLRVLVAEDNPVNQRLVQAILKHRGHAYVMVASGCEALAALDEETFDVVLMDLHMPEMDGLATAAAIRAREESTGAHVPILALTASAGDGDAARCLAAGMDGYILKPIRADELMERVESAAGLNGKASGISAPASAGGDEDKVPDRELTGLFVADAARLCAEIRDAVARRDGGALQAAAHRLRGSAGYFAAQQIFDLAARLEQRGRENDFNTDVERLCQDLVEELAHLERTLAASEE